MIPLNYHQLYYFWTIAKSGSYRAAAETLYLAVPTLSLQMAQLEKTHGMRLLERGRRGVSLTPQGREIFEHCERIFSEGEALAATLRKGPDAVAPTLRLGVQESISAWIVLKMLDFIAQSAPEMKVTVLGGAQSDLQEKLRRRALDVAVTNFDYTAALGQDFASRLVAKIPISFVGTPKIKRRVRKFPKDLAEVPLLVRTGENPIRRTLDLFLREHRVKPRLEIEIDNTLLIRLLALQGRGAAIIDTLTVNEDLKAGRLVKLHDSATRMEEYVWLLYNSRLRKGSALAGVIQGLASRFSIRL
jgi:LysR family transcriptional regulator, transcriptional activator of nhaA